MNKIFINGRFLGKTITGVQRYANEVTRALDKLIENDPSLLVDYQFIILTPKGISGFPPFKNLKIKQVGLLKGHLWEQIELGFHSRKGLLVNLCNTAPVFKRRQLVTIHDCAVFAQPDNYSWPFRAWYKILHPIIGRFSKQIITVSNFSKSELKKYCRIPEEKIAVIYEGADHIKQVKKDDTILQKLGLHPNSYVLGVSNLNKNKNFNLIIEALSSMNSGKLKLVLAGKSNSKIFKTQENKLQNFVLPTGYVSDGELRSLYENALVFIYPSLYEGFGLPALEAMILGCPVIVSKNASLPEICVDGVAYVGSEDINHLAKLIELLSKDINYRNLLKKAGYRNSLKYSWESCARGIIQKIRGSIQTRDGY